jgi:hypothetical protein
MLHEKEKVPNMTDHDPTRPRKGFSSDPTSTVEAASSVAGGSGNPGAGLADSSALSAHGSTPSTERSRRQKAWRLLSNRKFGRIAALAVIAPVMGLSLGLVASPSASAAPPVSGRAGSNARSGPAAGGASGTVSSVSKSSFSLTTSAGQRVTVDEETSTKYLEGTKPTSKSTVAKGKRVLVLGTTSGTTIKAAQVIVPTTSGPATASGAKVIPFQRGAPTTSKQVGQIPANWSQGSGTIVSGTAANRATEAALGAYPGGVVDRVVKLSNGDYNVHYIGVNWPHHVFLNQDFKVIGAE